MFVITRKWISPDNILAFGKVTRLLLHYCCAVRVSFFYALSAKKPLFLHSKTKNVLRMCAEGGFFYDVSVTIGGIRPTD